VQPGEGAKPPDQHHLRPKYLWALPLCWNNTGAPVSLDPDARDTGTFVKHTSLYHGARMPDLIITMACFRRRITSLVAAESATANAGWSSLFYKSPLRPGQASDGGRVPTFVAHIGLPAIRYSLCLLARVLCRTCLA